MRLRCVVAPLLLVCVVAGPLTAGALEREDGGLETEDGAPVFDEEPPAGEPAPSCQEQAEAICPGLKRGSPELRRCLRENREKLSADCQASLE